MPWSHDSTVQTLRLKYNAALSAHNASQRALTEATLGGVAPSADVIAIESHARAELERAREKLYAAMAALATGQRPSEHSTVDPLPAAAKSP